MLSFCVIFECHAGDYQGSRKTSPGRWFDRRRNSPALLKQLKLAANARVTVNVEKGQLVIRPEARPRYSLAQIMSQCDLTGPHRRSKAERAFLDAPRIGKEEI